MVSPLASQLDVASLKRGSTKPVIVLLHGFLGNRHDWQACLPYWRDHTVLRLDLPGHGRSHATECESLSHCCTLVRQTLEIELPPYTPIVMVGYSMGARIVMHGLVNGEFDSLNISDCVIEAGNFGLQSDAEKAQRWHNDTQWASRFTCEPIEQVLNDWYQQMVFNSLNHEQRQDLVTKRSANLGTSVAKMLLATSLAKQEWLLSRLVKTAISLHYLCGDKDKKFLQLAEKSGLSFRTIAEAGHNIHVEQPRAFANAILARINE